jgi:hypothetical protein
MPIHRPRIAQLPDGRKVVCATREIAFIVPASMTPIEAF